MCFGFASNFNFQGICLSPPPLITNAIPSFIEACVNLKHLEECDFECKDTYLPIGSVYCNATDQSWYFKRPGSSWGLFPTLMCVGIFLSPQLMYSDAIPALFGPCGDLKHLEDCDFECNDTPSPQGAM